MTRDELLAVLLTERHGPPPSQPETPADDELVKARRRRELNRALDDAPPNYRRGVHARRQEAV